jgi:hypothetical protein
VAQARPRRIRSLVTTAHLRLGHRSLLAPGMHRTPDFVCRLACAEASMAWTKTVSSELHL